MKKESKRYVTTVTQHSDHFLANLLGLKTILGMSLADAKPIARSKPGTKVHLHPYYEIKSCLPIEELQILLDEYEIEITVINQ